MACINVWEITMLLTCILVTSYIVTLNAAMEQMMNMAAEMHDMKRMMAQGLSTGTATAATAMRVPVQEEQALMKYSVYLHRNTSSSTPQQRFHDWFWYDLPLGYEQDKGDARKANRKMENKVKNSYRRHKDLVECMLKFANEHPTQSPSDISASAMGGWATELKTIANRAIEEAMKVLEKERINETLLLSKEVKAKWANLPLPTVPEDSIFHVTKATGKRKRAVEVDV
jgi:hypothetical protein